MTAHARLKNVFTEDKKYHNLMTWLKCTAAIVVLMDFPCNDENDNSSRGSDFNIQACIIKGNIC